MYTIGIKRKFLPGYRLFSVTHHDNETIDGRTRLILNCADKSVVVVPDIAGRGVKVFPDYHYAVTQKEQNEAARAALREEIRAEVRFQTAAPQIPQIPMQLQR